MRKNFVPQKDINLVVDGLNKYFAHMLQTQTFNPLEMKNFMEPIFSEAGYRNSTVDLNDPLNILLIHTNAGVGDFIFLSPSLRALRQIYVGAHITLAVNNNSSALAELCPYIDDLFLNPMRYDWRNFLSIYQWNAEFAKKLLVRRYDLVFPLCGFPSIYLLGYLSGAKTVLGTTPPRSPNHFLEPFGIDVYRPLITEMPRSYSHVPETNTFSAYMMMADALIRHPVVNREGEVWLSASDRAFARDLLSSDVADGRKVYAICMGGSAPRKMWPPQNYARLAQVIVEHESDTKFVLLGGGQNDGQSAAIFRQSVDEKFFNDHIIDMINKCTFRQSGAILELADMYIGNDTGTMHLAATVKTPALNPNCFSADLPFEHSKPRGMPAGCYPYHVPSVTVLVKHALPECQNSTDAYGCTIANRPHCITQITVEKMFEAYELLKQRINDNIIEPLFIS